MSLAVVVRASSAPPRSTRSLPALAGIFVSVITVLGVLNAIPLTSLGAVRFGGPQAGISGALGPFRIPDPASSFGQGEPLGQLLQGWYSFPQSTAPSPRYGSAMAYDPADGGVVLFGGGVNPGTGGQAAFGDTWIFSNGRWANMSRELTHSPSPRIDAAMVYDAADGFLLLFGGQGNPNGNTPLSDTWKFQGGQWTELFPSTSPPRRGSAGVAYDEKSNEVVLFGGCDGGTGCYTFLNDTWTFRGGDWSELQSPTVPGSRASPSMAYDSFDGYVLLFGGW